MKKQSRYYWMSDDITKNPTGMVLQNLPELNRKVPIMLMQVDRRIRGFSHLAPGVKPIIRYIKKKGRYPKDLEQFEGCWLITQKLKNLFESLDQSAFEFLPCDMIVEEASAPPEFWLCDVVRVIEAVVEGKSTCDIHFINDRKMYLMMPPVTFFCISDIISRESAIFRPKFGEYYVICNQHMRDICKEAKLQGIVFKRMLTDCVTLDR